MGKCTANNAQITQMTTAMSDLKSLMSGGPTQLAGMQEAQNKIKEGFDILSGKNTGPITLQYCTGYDETLLDGYDPVEDTTPTPSSMFECEAAGGTWVTKEVENFNLHDEINKLGTANSGLQFGTMVSDIKKKFGDLVPDLQEQIEKISPEAAEQLANPTIPELPKAGEIVDICTCSDPLYTDQESCEENGGTWNCRKGPMPDLSSLFSGGGLGGLLGGGLPGLGSSGLSSEGSGIFSGLGIDINAASKLKVPTIDPKKVCEFAENVEVKDKVVTDPKTGKQSVEKAKEIPALNPKVPEEPPKVSKPSPPVNIDRKLGELQAVNSFNRAVTGSLQAFMYLFTNEKWNMPKKDAKRVIQVLQYYGWRDFAESVNADFNFVLKTMAIPSVKNLTEEKINEVWVMFYRDYVKKTLTTAGIEKSEKRMWSMWKKIYAKKTTSKYEFDTAVLIAWNDALSKANKANTVVPEYSEPERVKQDVALAEEEQPETPPAEPAVTGGPKTITWKGAKITFTEPEVRQDPNNGTLKYYWDTSDKSAFAYISEIRSQEDLDGILKIARAQSGTYELFKTDRSKREYKIVYYGEHVKNFQKWSRAFIKTADGTYK